MRPFKRSTVQRFNVLESREVHSVPSLGSSFIERVKSELGFKAKHHEVIEGGGTYALREQSEAYGANFTGKLAR